MERSPLSPLFGWDLFLDSYQRFIDAGNDIQALKQLAAKHRWQDKFDFQHRLLSEQETIIVTDTRLKIVFASRNMLEMNGYRPEEVLGHRPAMFQGPETDADVKRQVREAVAAFNPFQAVLINYRKNGTPYACNIEAYPIRNRLMAAVHFIAFETLADQRTGS